MTEDQGPRDGFYRFVPTKFGNLTKGKLQMLGVKNDKSFQANVGHSVGDVFPAIWVDIPDPDPKNAEDSPSEVFKQGWNNGGAAFVGNEGCASRPTAACSSRRATEATQSWGRSGSTVR